MVKRQYKQHLQELGKFSPQREDLGERWKLSLREGKGRKRGEGREEFLEKRDMRIFLCNSRRGEQGKGKGIYIY